MKLHKDQAWEICVGMDWPWNYCATGTAADNATGLRDWIVNHAQDALDCRRNFGDTSYRVIVTCSLKVARAVAAEMRRYNRRDAIGKIGNGFGETRFL